jgi:hypothetical protein
VKNHRPCIFYSEVLFERRINSIAHIRLRVEFTAYAKELLFLELFSSTHLMRKNLASTLAQSSARSCNHRLQTIPARLRSRNKTEALSDFGHAQAKRYPMDLAKEVLFFVCVEVKELAMHFSLCK